MCVHQWPLYDHRMFVDSQLIYTCHNTRFQIYSKNYFNSMITLQSISMYKIWFKKPCFRAKETETHISQHNANKKQERYLHLPLSSVLPLTRENRIPLATTPPNIPRCFLFTGIFGVVVVRVIHKQNTVGLAADFLIVIYLGLVVLWQAESCV